jgi:hypothetical protein
MRERCPRGGSPAKSSKMFDNMRNDLLNCVIWWCLLGILSKQALVNSRWKTASADFTDRILFHSLGS